MAFWSWSRTAATNATADSTINWAEGQSPSSVNDSARAMMARLADWRQDISGTITTGGTSTAYTVASNQIFDTLAHMDGAMIAFVPHTTSGATVTLAVDSVGAKPLRSAPSVELPSGVLVQGTPYVATYNNSDAVWYLQGFTINPYIVPIGGLMPYIGASAPNSAFVLPFGQAISRTTYSVLFGLVSTTFGIGDGSTTFNVPDLRGRAIFGQDNMGGSAAGRITAAGGNFDGTLLGATGGSQNQTLTQAQLPSYNLSPSSITISSYTNIGTLPDIVVSNGVAVTVNTGASQAGVAVGTNAAPATSFSFGGTIPSGGSSSAHPILSPAMTMPYILRII